jgi:dipeptidyl-peptidase-4
MAMTDAQNPFKVGIAIAPVTDFRYYDAIYSERYMRKPAQNMEGYQAGSPLVRASNLNGRLLLVHGLADDKVRANQSLDFSEALIKAGKQFDMLFYPTSGHSISGLVYRSHLYQAQIDFLLNNL